MMENLEQILLLLGVTMTIVMFSQRLQIPSSLGYLLVGVILGPYTFGVTVSIPALTSLAEFGVVFLLFTIGLNFSLPQLHALRHQFLGLGTGQVVFTTLLVGIVTWLAGLPVAAAFVFGAAFAQSSTTIMASLLAERGEDNSQHGRLGIAMSVFQDVTAVPFLVIIPVLAISVTADVLALSLILAFAKAAFAFGLVFFAGRWLLRPLFHTVTERRSAEIFTLAVLLVALAAAWTTNGLGLSLAFGGFLAGMMLGETEFRHQVESSIRPFRDVLLGLFFIGIGMRFNVGAVMPIWHWAILGTLLILCSKLLIVTVMVRRQGVDIATALRTGLLMSVGGEFGLALIAISLDSNVLDNELGQIAITSVLISMIVGALLIRFNRAIATAITGKMLNQTTQLTELPEAEANYCVIIGGYGRVGHAIAVLLQESGVSFLAFDSNQQRVMEGRKDGHAVFYGDITDPELLSAIHVERASLIVMTTDCSASSIRIIGYLTRNYPQIPVIARARDLQTSAQLLDAGAVNAFPEIIEASLRLGEKALQILNVPSEEIEQLIQSVREQGYKPVLEKNKIPEQDKSESS